MIIWYSIIVNSDDSQGENINQKKWHVKAIMEK